MIGNNEILNYLLIKEDFLPEPTDLGDGKITIGSGLTDPKWIELYKKRGNKWSKEDNRKAVLEEIQKRRLWAEQNVPHWNNLPEPSQDALLSYRYNYNFTPKNSPKLFKALEDKNYLEAAKQIDATSKNPDFKNGLLKRRKEEQQWFLSGFPELSKPNDFAIPYKYPVPEYPTAAEAYRKSMTPITGNYSQGGQLQNHKQWKDLSYSEKNDIIKVAVRNGITTLPEIRQKYNEFADGGNLYAGGGYVYDMLPQLFASDGVQVRVTSGYRPNSKVQGSGKPSRHSMHEAADIVGDFSAIRRVLDNPESNTAKWMRANGYGYLDETSKTGTKKFWHDQKGDHSHYHVGKDSGIAEKFAASTGSTSNTTPIVLTGNYLDIAKAHIRNNEGWSPMPVADGPKNTGWRSVGYGFNDSGFRAKYPQGISKAYENGITKAQAEQELDYILGNMDSHLRRVYGNKWNSFNDNQKAAILDTYYQRPASVVGRNSAFYNAVMRGDNNAVNYLGVAGYNTRNNDRRKLFNSTVTQMPEAAQTVQQPLFYQPWNPQAASLYTPYSPLTPYPAPIFSPEEQEEYFAKQIAQAKKQQEAEQREKQKQEKADRINRFSLLMNLTDPYSSDSSSSSSTPFADAVSMLTQRSPIQYFSNGGSIHIKPENRGKFTRLKERTGHSASWFKEHGTPAQKKMAIFELNSRHWKHGLGGNLFKDGGDTKADIPVTFLTQSEAMPLLANNPNRTAVLDEVTVKPYRKIPQQYNNGITNQAANEEADEYVNRVTPTAEDLLNIGTLGGLNNLSPTQWARRAYDLRKAIKGNMSWDKFGNNWFYGNNGLVSDKYAQEHPYASAAINLAGDIGAFGTFSVLRKLPKYAALMEAENRAAQEASALNWKDMLSNNVKRTRIGDVEIDNPGLYYHQSDAGKAKNFVSTSRMRTPLEEYWLAKEEAGEHIPTKLRAGIEPGYPQDPGSAMFSQGNLWYDKLNGIRVNPKKPDLLVTAREMPIANKNASIMSDKASLKTLYEQGTRRVTNDNIYTQGPHTPQNTTAYTWEPEYGYRRISTESPNTIGWTESTRAPQITAENASSMTPVQLSEAFIRQHKNTTKYARDIAEDIFGLNPNNQIVDYNAMNKYGKVFNKRIKKTLPLAEKRGTLRSNKEPNVIVADGEGRSILYDRFINDTPILHNRKEVIHWGDPVTSKGELAKKYYYMTRPAEGPFDTKPSSFADRKNNTIVVIPRTGYKNMYKYTVPHEKTHIFIDGKKEKALFGNDNGLGAPYHKPGDTDISVDLYLMRPDEQLARGTQIKNYLGITDESPITPKQLKYAAENYVKDTGYDNNMTEFFSMIKDYKKAAKWLSLAPSFTLPIIGGGIGYGLYNKKSNKNKNIR